jgi:NAD(P)-dependent dehydrogenase (short-subunit alcohol dehydrogenase family)
VKPATVVVTGGTSGLGRELSLAFARRGHTVLALYHADARAAAELDAALAAASLSGRSFRHDVTDSREDAPVWSLPEITDASRLVLVHNAGATFEPKPLHLVPWDDFERCLAVALQGGWACGRMLLRPMLAKGGGHIVHVLTSAIAGLPPKGFAAYAAAKSALRSLTQSLAVEYGGRGVQVFSVSPGFMHTALTDRWHPSLREAVQRAQPAADPAIVAARVVALVEDEATAGHGEDYPIP